MKPGLAKLLACPFCRGKVQLDAAPQPDAEIMGGRLDCPKCRKEFPIREGIPCFVPGASYASTFSFEWKQWRRTQFDTASRRTCETTFHASTGRRPDELNRMLVLDAGCGAGRYMDLIARAGAEVVGVDLSQAVEVARENLKSLPNCHFLQADLCQPPFPPGTFDFVYSIGVLHHTPNPQESFRRLLEAVKPGGEIALWVYPRYRLTETFRYFPDQVNEVLAQDVNFRIGPGSAGIVRRIARILDWTMETSSAAQRAITTRLPSPWLYGLCHAAIPLYYLYRIPLFYPLRLVTKIAMDPDPEWRVLDTFDWYSPKYQSKHTYREVCAWFRDAGLEEITILPRPVAIRGRRPA